MKNLKLAHLIEKNKLLIKSIEIDKKIPTSLSFKNILSIYSSYLEDKNCKIKINQYRYKKNGHLKTFKLNDVTHELMINYHDEDIANIYILFHELVHLNANHFDDKSITAKQKELVADSTAKMLIKLIGKESEFKSSNFFKKYNMYNYSFIWMKNASLSKKKEILVSKQISNSFSKLSMYLINASKIKEFYE